MAAAVELVDETSTGEVLHAFRLELVSERVSAREIVERRVRHEVARFNEGEPRDNVFRGLIQPEDTEAALNGYRLKKRREIDADAQVALALRAFDSNGFLMLVGDRQVEQLDEEIVVTPGTRVSFVRLVPLMGG